jgi:hypothetical protein
MEPEADLLGKPRKKGGLAAWGGDGEKRQGRKVTEECHDGKS